jgi:hypothetical protein
MLAAYGVDVLDPGVSLRRIHVLLERLPPQGRRCGEMWSTESELLATLIDAVSTLTWVTQAAYGGKAPRPQPMPRPDARHKPQAPPQAAGSLADGSPRQTASWAEAIESMAGIDGVRVRNG